MSSKEDFRQYRDTDYYVSADGEMFRRFKKGDRPVKTYKRSGHQRNVQVKIYEQSINLPRVVWETFRGPIPKGYMVVHKNGCCTANNLGNLMLVEQGKYYGKNKVKNTRKIINLANSEIYIGKREASKILRTSTHTVVDCCTGKRQKEIKNPRRLLNLAWWDDVNGKAFRGDYDKYYAKHMVEE